MSIATALRTLDEAGLATVELCGPDSAVVLFSRHTGVLIQEGMFCRPIGQVLEDEPEFDELPIRAIAKRLARFYQRC